jgi:hypothetical protein
MISKRDIDKAIREYAENRQYIYELDYLDFEAYRAWGGRECDRNNIQYQRLHQRLAQDLEKITNLIGVIQVINKAYRDGDHTLKSHIRLSLARCSPYTYEPDDGPFCQFLDAEVAKLRQYKRQLAGLLRDANLPQSVPPIPRRARRTSAKTRACTPASCRVTVDRFGETLIENAKKMGGFKF